MTRDEGRGGVAWSTRTPPQDGRWLIGAHADNETVIPFRWSDRHSRWLTGEGLFLREEAIRLWADMPVHPFAFALPPALETAEASDA